MNVNDIEDIMDDDQSTDFKGTKYVSISQINAYINDIINRYIKGVSIPEKQKLDYREMLSCIKEIYEQLNNSEPWSLLSLLVNKSIPIKLVDEKELPDDPIKEDGTISPDTLGAYCSCYDQNMPIILLCPHKILNAAKNKEEAKILCKKVIIHEFAHALMDPTNWQSELVSKKSKIVFAPRQKNLCPNTTSDADRFMEESLANMLTLQYFNEVAKEEFDPVEDFIAKRQPAIYRFGITQFELKTDWTKWRDYKANKSTDFWSYWAALFAGKKIQ